MEYYICELNKISSDREVIDYYYLNERNLILIFFIDNEKKGHEKVKNKRQFSSCPIPFGMI